MDLEQVAFLDGGFRLWLGGLFVLLPGSGERVDLVYFIILLSFSFCRKDGYESLSSIGMVLAVEDGLKDGMDSMSVFIIHPF